MIPFKNSFAKASLRKKLLLSFGLLLFMLLLSSFAVQGLGLLSLGMATTIRLSLLVQSVLTFIVTPLLLAQLFDSRPFVYLSLQKAPSGRPLLLIFLAMVAVIPTINFLAEWNNSVTLPARFSELETMMRTLENNSEAVTMQLLSTRNFAVVLLNIFIVGVVAGLGEELFFRGIFQNLLQKHTRMAVFAVWISAFVFSAVHFQFYGFVPRMLLGALLGYLYLWSGNLWLAIFAHFLNNTFVVLFAYAIQYYPSLEWMESIGTGEGGIYFALASICITSTLLYLLRRNYRNVA